MTAPCDGTRNRADLDDFEQILLARQSGSALILLEIMVVSCSCPRAQYCCLPLSFSFSICRCRPNSSLLRIAVACLASYSCLRAAVACHSLSLISSFVVVLTPRLACCRCLPCFRSFLLFSPLPCVLRVVCLASYSSPCLSDSVLLLATIFLFLPLSLSFHLLSLACCCCLPSAVACQCLSRCSSSVVVLPPLPCVLLPASLPTLGSAVGGGERRRIQTRIADLGISVNSKFRLKV